MPRALLRAALFARAPCAEAFLESRRVFAISLATLSVCSWLVGIGDRHLDNFLVDGRTGEVVPIDFGHAFGTATFKLPVPELMPFRLTPQLVDVLAPLQRSALLETQMVHALSALRARRVELLRVCDVFVAEPLSDWTKGDARDGSPGSGGGGASTGGNGGGEGSSGGDVQMEEAQHGQADGAGSWCALRRATPGRSHLFLRGASWAARLGLLRRCHSLPI
jgi:DNA-dependent protein kinase catalytic subunit